MARKLRRDGLVIELGLEQRPVAPAVADGKAFADAVQRDREGDPLGVEQLPCPLDNPAGTSSGVMARTQALMTGLPSVIELSARPPSPRTAR